MESRGAERFKGPVNCGRPASRAQAAKGAVAGVFRAAGDGIAAASMRLRSLGQSGAAPDSLVAAWHGVAEAAESPTEAALTDLCDQTLAGWGALPFSDRVLLMDTWGYTLQMHPGILLPRPLLGKMKRAMRRQGGSATPHELNLVAVRCRPFMQTPAADLAVSILDAAVHYAAQAAARDAKVAAQLGPLLCSAAYASRVPATQGKLLLLRQAAATAQDPAEAAVYSAVCCLKTAMRCDSVTARRHVAASLARDSLECGGDIRETFIRAFGHVPEGEEEGVDGVPSSTERALEDWRRAATSKLQAVVEEGVAEQAGELLAAVDGAAAYDPSGMTAAQVRDAEPSVFTVHANGSMGAVRVLEFEPLNAAAVSASSGSA